MEYYLAKELGLLGHTVYIFTFSVGNQIVSTSDCEGFRIVRLPTSISLKGYHLPSPAGLKYVLNFLKREKPDIIHCQPIDSPLSLYFISLSNLFDYKIVGSIISQLNLLFSPWSISKKILFSLSKIVVTNYSAKKSVAIFAKSSGLMKIISRSYELPENKFRIIPLGADPELFKFEPNSRQILRKEMNVSKEDIVVVYSGKLDPTKGVDILITAMSPIINENSKVKLLIIGKGIQSYINYLKELILDKKVSSNVIFHPWATREKLSDLYSASDIGVWPGLSSISIVDAASVGLPLVIADTPVEKYSVENNNGFTFELNNSTALQECLERLVDNEKLRKERGRRSRDLVEKKLNWKIISLQYLAAYQNVLER